MAPSVKHHINGGDGYRTKCGGVLTLLMAATLTFITVFISQAYFRNDQPVISAEFNQLSEFPDINLVKSKFVPVLIAYSTEIDSILAVDMNKYFTVVVEKTEWLSTVDSNGVANTQVTYKQYPSVECSKLTTEEKSQYDYMAKEKAYIYEMMNDYGICVRTDDDFRVNGKGSDTVFVTINYQLKPCSLGAGCATAEELKKVNFYMVMPTPSFNGTNFENPVNMVINADDLVYVNPSVRHIYSAKMKRNSVFDFIGLRPTWAFRTEYFDIDKYFYNSGNRDPSKLSCTPLEISSRSADCVSYYELIIQSGGMVVKQRRKYKTATETLGEIGGVKEVIFTIFFLLYFRYNSIERDNYMIDKTFGRYTEIKEYTMKSKDNQELTKFQRWFKKKKLLLIDLFCCCLKKRMLSKWDNQESEYRATALELIQQDLDLINTVSHQSLLKVLIDVLMDEDQKTLVPILVMNKHIELRRLAGKETAPDQALADEKSNLGPSSDGKVHEKKELRQQPYSEVIEPSILSSIRGLKKEGEEHVEESKTSDSFKNNEVHRAMINLFDQFYKKQLLDEGFKNNRKLVQKILKAEVSSRAFSSRVDASSSRANNKDEAIAEKNDMLSFAFEKVTIPKRINRVFSSMARFRKNIHSLKQEESHQQLDNKNDHI